jgi:hypothetical protein
MIGFDRALRANPSGLLEMKTSGHPIKDARMHAPCLDQSQ